MENKKLHELTPEYCVYIPEHKEPGILYISKEFDIAVHLCACGCGKQTVTPLNEKGWTLTEKNNKVTLRPSIGNFSGEKSHHAHYFITNNKIEWL